MGESRSDGRAVAASHVFYRKLKRALPRIVSARGVWLEDDRGKRYLDGSGGAMVANVGHGVAEIAEAIGAQAAAVAYVNGTLFTNEPVEELADLLAAKAPPGLDRCYFLSSGSEAVEAALKLARQYHVERGDAGRSTVIARTPGYHGNTILALAASAREHYKAFYGPWLVDVRMIGAPYPYRAADGSPEMTGEALETAILAAGPGNVAAFIAETIGGSSTGASVPPPGYYAKVREICDRYGVLFIADEVLVGAGRTGTFFAIEHYTMGDGSPVVPDIITMGKGLNGGYAPLSALITRASIVDTIARGSGNFQHAQTYSHTPVAAAAGVATVRYLDEHRLVDRARTIGPMLQSSLRDALAGGDASQIVGDVRGIGMLAAVEFVADKRTKRPFARSLHVAEAVVDRALDRGLVVWPNAGHADGADGDLVMVAPPFVITEAEIGQLVERLALAIGDVASSIATRST